ncbi:ABC transporter substrate-binding protein [Patescibacteria group bacterium]
MDKKKLQILIPVLAALLLIGVILLRQNESSKGNILSQRSGSVSYPITVESCGELVTFDSVPERTMAFDTNMMEMMLALELEDRMVGYWTSGVEVGDQYKEQAEKVPFVEGEPWPPPGMETILSYNLDFVFGAWEYNFSDETGVNPEKLADAGVKSYVLTESCIAQGVEPSTTIGSTYTDILNLGTIFNKRDKAQELVDEMKQNIQETQNKIGQIEIPLKGFYYGGGSDAAFSAGKYAMVSKMMLAVGAENILSDVEDDWIPEAGWETIIERDPKFIMIDDTPWESAEDRIATLESLPQLADITAIKEKKYIVFPWTYILPGMEMDDGVMYLAKNLYPEKFE